MSEYGKPRLKYMRVKEKVK